MKSWAERLAVVAFFVWLAFIFYGAALFFYGAALSDIEKHKNCLWAAENSFEAYRRFCK